uniref:Uncharacterized protein n=1 Tax=Romanomermis culicivorax TaxID=13658 RepID=A0A915HMD0_ROMCU
MSVLSLSVEKIADEAYLAMIGGASSKAYDNKTSSVSSTQQNNNNVVDFSSLGNSNTNETGRFWSIKSDIGGKKSSKKKTATKEFVQMNDMSSSSTSHFHAYNDERVKHAELYKNYMEDYNYLI